MQTYEAKKIAKEKSLDLVEVNPKARPPVCKIMDYGRYKYDEKKQKNASKKRQRLVELKEVKLRPKTDDHDIDFKVKHVRRFLEEGNKVKITVRFRGREITHPETAERQIRLILAAVTDIGALEQSARMEGRTMTAIVSPKPNQKPRPQKAEDVASQEAEDASLKEVQEAQDAEDAEDAASQEAQESSEASA
jgi:translation initiation factor IF-3